MTTGAVGGPLKGEMLWLAYFAAPAEFCAPPAMQPAHGTARREMPARAIGATFNGDGGDGDDVLTGGDGDDNARDRRGDPE